MVSQDTEERCTGAGISAGLLGAVGFVICSGGVLLARGWPVLYQNVLMSPILVKERGRPSDCSAGCPALRGWLDW